MIQETELHCLNLIHLDVFLIFHPHYRLFLGLDGRPSDEEVWTHSSYLSSGVLLWNLLGPLQPDSLYSILKNGLGSD